MPFLSPFKHLYEVGSAVHKAIQLPASNLANDDLLPTPPNKRNWNAWYFFCYWWSESLGVVAWSLGASFIALGANIRDALLVVFSANLLSALVIVLNSRAASKYHVGFPILARGSFGINGQYLIVFLRVLLVFVWSGVQLYYQARFLSICMRAISTRWNLVYGGAPEGQNVTTQTMIGFLAAFTLSLPMMYVHTSRMRYVFFTKAVVVTCAGMGVVTWITATNRGLLRYIFVNEPTRPSSSTFAWGIVALFNAIMGANSALLVSAPDLARYAKTPKSQIYGQALGLPLAQVVCAAYGIIATAAARSLYGVTYWNPYDLLNGILDQLYTGPARAGVFFASLTFAFGALGTNMACNVIPFAAGVTALAPRYINIVRGQFLCLVLAWAVTPWNIVGTSSYFLTFLNGYCIFQGPIVAIMLVDYYVVRHGNWHLKELFSWTRSGRYFYSHGVNWRAMGAAVVGFLLPLPGLMGSLGLGVGEAAPHMFHLGWTMSFLIGGASYWAACRVWEVPSWEEDRHKPFETMAEGEQEEVRQLRLDMDA